MVGTFAKQTITVIRPGQKELRGTVYPDWDNVSTHQVSGCSVQPAGTMLSQDGRVLGLSDGMTAYLPPGADIRAGDRVMVDGLTYTVNGVPRVWTSPSGARSNIQAALERWSG